MTLFFVVDNISNFQGSEIETFLDNFLFPINGLDGNNMTYIEKLLSMGKTVLIDSGIFSLAADYARKKQIPLHEAFAVNPAKFDGFSKLFDAYVSIIGKLKERVWGYIEMDIGGQDNKIAIRSQIESMGLSPMPVYHPLNDTPEYFDYLAERYPRICVGNLVDASPDLKNRIIWDIDRRRKKHPHLWIHFLGISLSPHCFTFQVDSCDSSGIASLFRWHKIESKILLKDMDFIQRKYFTYRTTEERKKAYKISAVNVDSYIRCEAAYRKELSCS